ncbi:MAG: cation diffusion facilitator family transporter [Bacillota bacterium]
MGHDDGPVSFSDLGRAGGAVMLAAWLGLGLNVVLAAAKIAAGLLAPSQAMLADGLHSAGDAAAALAVSIGIRVGRRPPDADHPHGHAKAEEVAALIVGVILGIAGLEIGLDSVVAVWSGGPTGPGRLALYVAGVAIVLKEGMYRYQSWLAAREGDAALAAAAAEHRTCALKTGITFLSVVGARWGLRWLDPAAGFIIGVFVMIMATRISRRAIDGLMGRVTVGDSSRVTTRQPPL